MFTLSAKGVYGLTAVVDLAERYRSGPVQIREIADRHGIPQHYLEQILVALKKAGHVESFRGAAGGYSLARAPESLTIRAVLSDLEGPLAVVPDGRRASSLAFLWEELHTHLEAFLSLTVAEVVRKRARAAGQLNYVI